MRGADSPLDQFKERVIPQLSSTGGTVFNLERKGDLRTSVKLITLFLVLEIAKQMLNFEIARSKGGHYPLPSPLLLLMTEALKLVLVVAYTLVTRQSFSNYQLSAKFSVPALCYLITNLLYLTALQHVAPPIWMILIQTRTIYTAVTYKSVFGRSVTLFQMLGCLLIVLSIPTAKLSDLLQSQHSTGVSTTILLISQTCAVLSTAGAVAVELLLKNDRRSFVEQQTWLYMWGSLYALLTLPLMVPNADVIQQIMALTSRDCLLVSLSVISTALAGLCVPLIVRNLDTIVKDYLCAANNIVLSAVTAVLFPASFSLSWVFICSLALLFIGIILYERYAAPSTSSSPSSSDEGGPLLLPITTAAEGSSRSSSSSPSLPNGFGHGTLINNAIKLNDSPSLSRDSYGLL